MVLLVGIYVFRFRESRREAGGRGAGWKEATCFAIGMAVLFTAVASPIDGLGEDYLFSAHMVQHILLGSVSDDVIKRAPVPVMVVRAPRERED